MDDLTHRLATFAKFALRLTFDGYEVDGFDLQKKAVELGLLLEKEYDPVLHGNDVDAEPGDTWYVMADDLKAVS